MILWSVSEYERGSTSECVHGGMMAYLVFFFIHGPPLYTHNFGQISDVHARMLLFESLTSDHAIMYKSSNGWSWFGY